MLGVTKFLLTFAAGKVFRGRPLLDIHGSLQLLNSSHVRERDKALLRAIIAENNTNFQSSFQQEFSSMSSEFTFGDNSDKSSIF